MNNINNCTKEDLNIIVIGASGDLARKKIFPALFSLYCQNLLPEKVNFFGFARSKFSHQKFREKIVESLTCRYTPEHSCESYISKFIAKCFYCQGDYGLSDSFSHLHSLMREKSASDILSNIFYFAIPPSLFSDVARAIGNSGLIHGCDDKVWSRVVIEKPFGRDKESSNALTRELADIFTENQTYRIDHYLGKEIVQNLLVLRFANQIFRPLWNADYIQKVDILWSENKGVEGRGGYFDNYGIIRDVIQNHLLQILTLVAMEEPASLSAGDIRNRKVEVLRTISPVTIDDVILGQYTSAEKNGIKIPGYTEDKTVPDNSITPTFADIKLSVNNKYWRGVPFSIRAGKGLSQSKTEVKIRFKTPENNIFCSLGVCPPANELVIRVQPNEGMHFSIVNKIPGMKMSFNLKELDLSYNSAYSDYVIPDAYESLLLDVIEGEKSLFIRKDELEVAWDIFSPLLHYVEKQQIKPKLYPFGSEGVRNG